MKPSEANHLKVKMRTDEISNEPRIPAARAAREYRPSGLTPNEEERWETRMESMLLLKGSSNMDSDCSFEDKRFAAGLLLDLPGGFPTAPMPPPCRPPNSNYYPRPVMLTGWNATPWQHAILNTSETVHRAAAVVRSRTVERDRKPEERRE